MKTIFPYIFIALFFTACSGETPETDAQKICDCYEKANSMKADDPNRNAEQDKCIQLQNQLFDKYKNDADQTRSFNSALEKCK